MGICSTSCPANIGIDGTFVNIFTFIANIQLSKAFGTHAHKTSNEILTCVSTSIGLRITFINVYKKKKLKIIESVGLHSCEMFLLLCMQFFLYLYNVFHRQLLRIQKDIRNEMSLEYYDTEKHIDDHIQCTHPHLHNFLWVLEHILLHNYIQNFRSNWNMFHCHKCWTC